MVAMLGASQNAQWLTAHTWHLLEPSFSIPRLVFPGVLKTISQMMLRAVQIDAPRFPKIPVAGCKIYIYICIYSPKLVFRKPMSYEMIL